MAPSEEDALDEPEAGKVHTLSFPLTLQSLYKQNVVTPRQTTWQLRSKINKSDFASLNWLRWMSEHQHVCDCQSQVCCDA